MKGQYDFGTCLAIAALTNLHPRTRVRAFPLQRPSVYAARFKLRPDGSVTTPSQKAPESATIAELLALDKATWTKELLACARAASRDARPVGAV